MTTEQDALPPLWDDNRIDEAVDRVTYWTIPTIAGKITKASAAKDKALTPFSAEQLLKWMRREYEAKLNEFQAAYLYYIEQAGKNEARIAELQRRLDEANAWQPVPDGFYHGETAHDFDFEVDGEWLRTYLKGATGWGCKIPTEKFGWKLCRQVRREANDAAK